MRVLRPVGDPLLVVVAAPFRHQRVQRVEIRNAVGLGFEARIVPPGGRAHDLEPPGPLPVLARRDRGIAVLGRQDRDGGAVAVADPFPGPRLAAEPGIGKLGHRQGRQRLLDRDVDDGRLSRLRRVDAGAGRGQPADKRRLLADRADRRLGEVVDLPGQQPGDAAAEHQGEVAGRIVGARAVLAERRYRDDCRARIEPPQRRRIAPLCAQGCRAALDHDQIGGGNRGLAALGLAVVEVLGQQGRPRRAEAGHLGADIGEETPGDRGGQAVADLHDAQPLQQRHRRVFPSSIGASVAKGLQKRNAHRCHPSEFANYFLSWAG